MTTLRGAIRSYNAAVHRAERAHQKRAREAALRYKQQLKAQEIVNAAKAVQEYEEYLEILTSLHMDSSESISWEDIKNEAPPSPPTYISSFEDKAKQARLKFKPNLYYKLFGSRKKLLALDIAIQKGKKKDETNFQLHTSEHQKQLESWEKINTIAKGICDKQPSYYRDAIAHFNPFEDIAQLGSNISFTLQSECGTIDLDLKDENIIPEVVLSLTSTGKLSRKKMPISKYHKLYQDHVCSAVLRLARETCALLPFDKFVVNASNHALNTATGKIEHRTILSVAFSPATLSQLNFECLSPTDAMQNFQHTMKYSSSNGFSGIVPINLQTLISGKN